MTQSFGPLSPQEVQHRLEKAGGMPDRKAFDPDQPRDPHTGEWIDVPGAPATLFSEATPGGRTVDGIKLGAPGKGSAATEQDMEKWAAAIDRTVKDFPELRKPRKGGSALKSVEMTTNPISDWGKNAAAEMMLQYNMGQTTGGVTGVDARKPGDARMLLNEDPELRDGVHRLTKLTAEAGQPDWFGPGSQGPVGQLYHELGHAVARGAALEVPGDLEAGDDKYRALFNAHGLTHLSQTISTYASTNPAEAFGELFAGFMSGKLSADDRKKFEGLLTEMMGRKVGDP